MTENNPATPPNEPTEAIEPVKKSKARTISLGAAILAVPVGAAWLYATLQKSADRQDRALEEGAKYDVTALKKVDPALIRYHEIGSILSGMQSPVAIAIDPKGQVMIGGDQMVRIVGSTGQWLGEIHLDQTPTCLAATESGKVLVGVGDHVEVFGADGQRTATWQSFGAGSQITGIAVSGSDIYVADSGRRVVMRCSLDGQVEATLAQADASRHIPGLVVPSPHLKVAVTAEGMVWISNPGRHRLEAYNRDGEPQRFFGAPGTSIEQFLGCCNPSNFALLADGRIVTAEKGIPRVKVYLPDGRLESVVVGPNAFGDNITGLELAVDVDGRVLVLEPGAKNLRVFAPNP